MQEAARRGRPLCVVAVRRGDLHGNLAGCAAACTRAMRLPTIRHGEFASSACAVLHGHVASIRDADERGGGGAGAVGRDW
jgi:hypothetical protein